MKNKQKRPVGLSKYGKIVAVGSAILFTTSANAAITAPDFTTPIADIGILLGAMLGFGAIAWGSRKLLNFMS